MYPQPYPQPYQPYPQPRLPYPAQQGPGPAQRIESLAKANIAMLLPLLAVCVAGWTMIGTQTSVQLAPSVVGLVGVFAVLVSAMALNFSYTRHAANKSVYHAQLTLNLLSVVLLSGAAGFGIWVTWLVFETTSHGSAYFGSEADSFVNGIKVLGVMGLVFIVALLPIHAMAAWFAIQHQEGGSRSRAFPPMPPRGHPGMPLPHPAGPAPYPAMRKAYPAGAYRGPPRVAYQGRAPYV